MSLPEFMIDDCRQGPPVPLALFNGTADPMVPYEGGMITVLGMERDRVLSTEETLAHWRARNGCPDRADETDTINQVSDRCRVEHVRWRQCSGVPVTLFRIVNGGHTWPSGTQYLPKGLIGNVSHEIDGAEEAWRFFSRF